MGTLFFSDVQGIAIPWLFQSVSNSLYSPRPLIFSGFCSVTGVFWSVFSFPPRCVKVTCLENSNGKMQEKVWLPCSWLQAVALVLAIQLKQVRSLAATIHPAPCSMSSVKFGIKSWESSKLTRSLLRWSSLLMCLVWHKIISWKLLILTSWKNRSYSKTPASFLKITASDLCNVTLTNPHCCFYCN